MKRNNPFSREKVISKQDVYCSEKLLGFSNDKSSPHMPLIQWDVLFQPWQWARRYPLHPDTMALAGALAFLGSALLSTMRVFKKRQPGLETKHSGIEVNLPRDAGMWSTPGFLRQRQHESLCCISQAFSETSTSYTLPPRLQLALAVLQREMRFALAVLLQNSLTPSPLGGNMCCGLGNILVVKLHLQQSYPPPTVCFWLSDSASHRGERACEHESSDTALGSAKPQISVTLFIPPGIVYAQIGPSLFHPG